MYRMMLNFDTSLFCLAGGFLQAMSTLWLLLRESESLICSGGGYMHVRTVEDCRCAAAEVPIKVIRIGYWFYQSKFSRLTHLTKINFDRTGGRRNLYYILSHRLLSVSEQRWKVLVSLQSHVVSLGLSKFDAAHLWIKPPTRWLFIRGRWIHLQDTIQHDSAIQYRIAGRHRLETESPLLHR